MRTSLFVLLALLITSFGLSQDSLKFNWELLKEYNVGADAVWSVDGLENVYASSNSVISKFDSSGTLKFTQSIKSLGNMTQLEPINTMKIVHFSEEQQTLCYFDNTLSPNDDCLELIDREVFNASRIASSGRSDKVWVYDNLNSSLRLLDLEGDKFQSIEINNLKGVLGLEDIVNIKERYNQLFILDQKKGVFVFDMYGSLVNRYPMEGVIDMDVVEKGLFLLFDNKLVSMSLDGVYKVNIPLPVEGITQFDIENEMFFFEKAEIVHKYRLQISK